MQAVEKVIGKQGRTADAIRIILNAMDGKTRKRLMLEVVDQGLAFMPFNDIELQRINKIVGGFCEEKIPDHLRSQIKVCYEIRG